MFKKLFLGFYIGLVFGSLQAQVGTTVEKHVVTASEPYAGLILVLIPAWVGYDIGKGKKQGLGIELTFKNEK